MEQLNKVNLIGYIGNVRITELNNVRVARFTVMTSMIHRGKNGDVKESTWHNCTAFENNKLKLAGIEKGAAVKVEGRIRNNRYTDSDNNEHTIFEIVVKSLEILDNKILDPEK